MATIVVAEDERDLNTLVRRHLEDEGHRVVQAYDGAEAVLAVQHERPDLLVLDWMMPKLDGLEVCRRVRRESIVPILMLTARSEEIDRVLGLEVGADDYLVKPFAFAELLARVRTLLRRGASPATDSTLTVADLELDLMRRRVVRGGRRIQLTAKEFSLLELLIRHKEEVLPRSMIASQVWDMNFDSSTNVVDVAIRRLRAKIDDPFERKLIHTVRGMGYMLDASGEP